MKVLLVNGSPHEHGCTYTALEEVAGALRKGGVEAEIFWIGKQPLGGCIACNVCRRTGKCVFDDVVNTFAPLAAEADGFVFGSPVHYAGASGNMTGFLDRLYYSTRARWCRLKPAAVVVSARRGGSTATYEQLLKYPGISEMPIISTRYWNMVHGSTPDEVRQDAEGMSCMRVLGTNMAYFLRCRAAAEAAGIMPPEEEPRVATDFIR